MIVVQGQSIGVPEFKGTTYEGEVARMAIANYAHVLRGNGNFEVKRFTFGQFADAIARQYDLETPQNAEVVRVLRVLDERNPWASAPVASQCLYLAVAEPSESKEPDVMVFLDEGAAKGFASIANGYSVVPAEVRAVGDVRFDAPLSVGDDCYLAVCAVAGEVEAVPFWAKSMRNQFVAENPKFTAADEVVRTENQALGLKGLFRVSVPRG